MENILDIKKKKNLNFILPLHKEVEFKSNDFRKKKTAVVVHLFYKDMVEKYLEYISLIPLDIDIIFTVSDIYMKDILYKYKNEKKRDIKIIMKENRGRDISAFLVACRKEILKYDYMCFLHDKKEKDEATKKDVELWVKGLWENRDMV